MTCLMESLTRPNSAPGFAPVESFTPDVETTGNRRYDARPLPETPPLAQGLERSTGRVHVNPLLYVLGRRVYSARADGTAFFLVAQSDVSGWVGAQPCVQVGANLLVEKPSAGSRR